MIDPKLLCRKHLLAEHLECHMLVGAIKKGKNLKGYVDKGLVELDHIGKRHRELVREMKRRGYRHYTPLKQPYVRHYHDVGKVDMHISKIDLILRCDDCMMRIFNNWLLANN